MAKKPLLPLPKQPEEFVPASASQQPLPIRADYPWDVWTKDSLPRVYVRGKHFFTKALYFQRTVLNYARRNGLLVRTRLRDNDSVVIQWHSAGSIPASLEADQAETVLPPDTPKPGPKPGVDYLKRTEYLRKRRMLRDAKKKSSIDND